MDPTMSNFILTLIGLSIGSCVTLITACGKCTSKSRCTNIKTPCLSCDRDVLDDADSVYEDAEPRSAAPENFKSVQNLRNKI